MSTSSPVSNFEEMRRRLGPLGWAAGALDGVLKVSHFDDFLARIHQAGRPDFFASALEQADLRPSWADECLARIPRTGALLAVANHPHGMTDGLVAMEFLLRARPDTLVVGNEWLAQIPGIRPWLIEVDPEGRSNLTGTRRVLDHLKRGGAILMFPAGEVSSLRPWRRRVEDPRWSDSFVRLARRTKATVLPLHIAGRNSGLFQTAGLLHPRLRTTLLLREFLAQKGKVIRLRAANPVTPTQLAQHADDAEASEFVRLRCELLPRRERAPRPAATEPMALR